MTTTHSNKLSLLHVASLTAIGALCIGTQAMAAEGYACERLDSNGVAPQTRAINDRNEVVAEFDVWSARSVRWDRKGKAHVLKAPKKASRFQVRDINNSGVAVGAIYMLNQTGDYQAGWTAQKWMPDGTFVALPRLPGQDAEATAINNLGTIVGSGYVVGQPFKAVMWTDAGQTILPALEEGLYADARAINDKGVVVGAASKTVGGEDVLRAVRWRDGKIQDLGTPPGTARAVASAINNDGVIVGTAIGETYVPVAWVNGVPKALNTLGSVAGQALSINRHGEIVGYTNATGMSYWANVDAAPVRVTDLISAEHPCVGPAPFNVAVTLQSLDDINANGVIAAVGQWTDPVSHFVKYTAFRLVPLDSSSSSH